MIYINEHISINLLGYSIFLFLTASYVIKHKPGFRTGVIPYWGHETTMQLLKHLMNS